MLCIAVAVNGQLRDTCFLLSGGFYLSAHTKVGIRHMVQWIKMVHISICDSTSVSVTLTGSCQMITQTQALSITSWTWIRCWKLPPVVSWDMDKKELHAVLKPGTCINLNYLDIAEIIVVLMSARELFVRTVEIPLNFWMLSLLNDCISR